MKSIDIEEREKDDENERQQKKTKRNERNRVRGVDGRPARCVTTAFKNRSIIRRDNRYVGPKERERETEGEGQVT